jgi:DNA polymerase-3 subunit alpha
VSFHDFCRRVDLSCLNRKTIESLIWAGAFESLSHTRKGLLDCFESVTTEIAEQRKMRAHGQFGLFDGLGDDSGDPAANDRPIGIDEHARELLNAKEKEMLGVYVSDHPLLGVEGLLSRMCDCGVAALAERTPGEVVTIGGMVTNFSKKVTKNGGIMLLLRVEDLGGMGVEVLVFSKVYEQYAPLLRPDAILLLKGRVDRDARDDSVKLMAMEVKEPNLGENRPLTINLPADSCTPNVVDSLKEVLSGHPGSTQVFLSLGRGGKTTILRLGSQFWVDTSNGLHAELKALLGPQALVTI